MARQQLQECWECGRERERCTAVTTHLDGRIEYVCPQCYRDLGYDYYVPPKDVKDARRT